MKQQQDAATGRQGDVASYNKSRQPEGKRLLPSTGERRRARREGPLKRTMVIYAGQQERKQSGAHSRRSPREAAVLSNGEKNAGREGPLKHGRQRAAACQRQH